MLSTGLRTARLFYSYNMLMSNNFTQSCPALKSWFKNL